MQRLTSLLVAPTLCLAVIAMSPHVHAQLVLQTGLDGPPYKSFTGPGVDFVQASVTTRTAGVVTPTQVCPFAVAMPALPTGAAEMTSYACWNYMLTGGWPIYDTIDINGTAVQGSYVAGGYPDLCGAKAGGVTYIAEVTGLLVLGGANSVGDACDKALGGDPAALGQGITLLTVFRHNGKPARVVDVWVGYTSTESSSNGNASAHLDLSYPYVTGGAHFFVNALNGHFNFGDQFFVNSTSVGNTLNGTAGSNNAWVGLAGPLVANNLYDAAEDDIATWMSVGDTTLNFRTVPSLDCIGHSFAALSLRLDCGEVTTYCTAKTNSLGCVPKIAFSGYPSAGAPSGFKVSCTNARNNKSGLLFYGISGAASLPFQGGTLCVKSPIKRTPAQNSGGNAAPINDCSGDYTIDMNKFATGLLGGNPLPELSLEGTVVNCQWWGRDQGFPAPNNTMLSAGLQYTICP